MRILFILFFAQTLLAQNSFDALLFSEKLFSTTARSAATGSSMSALGGDLSAVNLNPAGLGFFRTSELSICLGFHLSDIKSTFVSDSSRPNSYDNRSSFNMGSLAFVYTRKMDKDWKNVNFGISYNRLSSFNRSFQLEGISTGSRLVNMVEQANNQNTAPSGLNPFEEQLAWNAYLIDNPGGGNLYIGALKDSNYIKKSQYIRQIGGNNELGLSFAGSYKHKLYLGATLGIGFLKFRDQRDYFEEDLSNNIDFKSMKFSEDRNVEGLGINLKIGFIYRINTKMKIGLAVHTPTAYALTETYFTSLSGAVIWDDTLRITPEDDPYFSPTAKYEHNFNSPWLFSLSWGSTFGEKDSKLKGFVGVEADYINYSTSNFSLKLTDTVATQQDRDYLNQVNKAIKENYQSVARVRIGGELAYEKFRLRAGYKIQTSPYLVAVKGVDDIQHEICIGAGFKGEVLFIDLSYQLFFKNFEYNPYYPTSSLNNQRSINFERGGLLLLTLGLRF